MNPCIVLMLCPPEQTLERLPRTVKREEAGAFIQRVEAKGLQAVHKELALDGEPSWSCMRPWQNKAEAEVEAELEAAADATAAQTAAAAYLKPLEGDRGPGLKLGADLGPDDWQDDGRSDLGPDDWQGDGIDDIEARALHCGQVPQFHQDLMTKYPEVWNGANQWLYSGGVGNKFFTRVRLASQLTTTFPDDPTGGRVRSREDDKREDVFVGRTLELEAVEKEDDLVCRTLVFKAEAEATPTPQPGAVPHCVFSCHYPLP